MQVPSRAWHRVQQFFRATFAWVRPSEIEALEAILSPAQMALFRRMARSDQRHSLDVLSALRRAGHDDRSLARAALLHDCGKSVPAGGKSVAAEGKLAGNGGPLQRITVWHRTLIVLLQRLAPGWLDRLAFDGRGWRRPFAIHIQHAQTSAELAAQAGCTPKVVDLIRGHHEPEPQDERSALLQWADEQN
jgi:hypothetical protein